jgi:type I restriction enzyme, S subunit
MNELENKIEDLSERLPSRWQAYSEYKESGIKWIGKIPTHWELGQLNKVIKKFVDYRGNTPEKTASGILLITAKNISDGFIDFSSSQEFIPEELYKSWMVRGFPEIGDVLVTTEAPLGKVAQITDSSIALGQRIILLKSDSSLLYNSFLKYYILSDTGQAELGSNATGSTAVGIKASKLKHICVLLPSLKEQVAIAVFLDRETAQIEALIAKKEALIELLQEQRSAIISHAVTKGLNADVPMRDSGIEWLGEIPAHWEVERNKNLFKLSNLVSTSGDEELLTVSHITGITPRSEKDVNMFLAESNEGYKIVNKHDLVINTMWAWMGALGISEYEGIASPSYHVYVINAAIFLPKYLDFLYRTPQHVYEINRFSKGIWSSRLRLYPTEFLGNMFTVIPPYEEQVEIVNYLNNVLEEMNALEETLASSITKLQEYRTALISAAVTGKIDVRGEV